MSNTVQPSRAQRAYNEILARIVRGDLAPGERIVEREIAASLGISRTPIREAIRRLEVEGLLEPNPASAYARPVVTSLTFEDARDLHDMVAALESVAARRTAELPELERRRVAGEMRKHNASFRRATAAPEPEVSAVIGHDQEVHAAYIRTGGGPRLLALRAVAKPQLDRYLLRFVAPAEEGVEHAFEEHEAIADAIEAGDAQAAAAAVLANWANAERRLRAAMKRSRQAPADGR